LKKPSPWHFLPIAFILFTVRRVLLILMIAVLPLRALAGDWMLLGMATKVTTAGPSMVMAMADCDMHLKGQSSSSTDTQCGSCSLCYPVAQPTPFDHALSFNVPAARPESGDDDFVSAASTRSFRPPSL
jgi:hypothetical protein